MRVTIYQWLEPRDEYDSKVRFVVLEDRGDRALIKFLDSGLPIAPTMVVRTADIKVFYKVPIDIDEKGFPKYEN